jgi:hypothetical protein
MISAFALLFAAAVAPLLDPPPAPVMPDVAAERVRACGFKNVAVKRDPTLQEDVLVVSGVTQASDEQLRCSAKASLSSDYFVQFPESVNASYEPIYVTMRKERDRADARSWLDHRGMLSRLPQYDRGKTDDLQFAHQLESLCGPKAAGAFVQQGQFVTLKMGTLEHPALDDDTLWCLINAASASDFPLGFVGNEYHAGEEKPSRE